MPDAVSFVVTTYYKLAKDETGVTRQGTVRIPLGTALEWVLRELPDDAFKVFYLDSDGNPMAEWTGPESPVSDHVRMEIDWTKVPDSIRDPVLPARRR